MKKIFIPEIILESNLSSIIKMKTYRFYIYFSNFIKKNILRKDCDDVFYVPMVYMNRCFGHEFLLKRYSGMKKPLYSIIEHGLYLGNNNSKAGNDDGEWDLGNILTTGDYRKKTINEYFPKYYCETIGPMIHYAIPDVALKKELEDKLKDGKTLTFFPMHSIERTLWEYDRNSSLIKVQEVARELKCKNIIINVFHNEYELYSTIVNSIEFKNLNVIVTTCGDRYDEFFLDKQRTIIDFTDVAIANGLGTNLGYVVYYRKPYILFSENATLGGDTKTINEEKEIIKIDETVFEQENKQFYSLFGEIKDMLSKEQYEFCDYYWGFSKVKTPDEIKDIYNKCKKNYKVFKKLNSHK